MDTGFGTRYFCGDEERRNVLRERRDTGETTLNGIDFLEVVDRAAPDTTLRQKILLLQCFGPLPGNLTPQQIEIRGGERIRNPRVVWVRRLDQVVAGDPRRPTGLSVADETHVLVIETQVAGDFSTYQLTLVKNTGTSPRLPLDGFDPRLASVDFSFKVECPSPFDCRPDTACPPLTFPEPELDYLAKDFPSFRRLMLDRMAATLPDWRERHPADLGVALVEMLAYVADQLSYYQDAAVTEAYLGTARLRISQRRHARLVDYRIDEGAAAQTLIAIEVAPGADGAILPGPVAGNDAKLRRGGTPIVSRLPGVAAAVLPPSQLQLARQRGATIFETAHELELRSAHNRLPFYTWSDQDCCLPAGATSATLAGHYPHLKSGDLLIFEELIGPKTGQTEDADPRKRHAVRLSSPPVGGTDLLTGDKVTEIFWHQDDALPFPLCLSAALGEGKQQRRLEQVSVARGNVVLADHGDTRIREALPPVPAEDELGEPRFRPLLEEGPLTHRLPWGPQQLAAPVATLQRPAALAADALPAVWLDDGSRIWEPRRDLLAADAFTAGFVAEIENDGRARLRFGDNRSGLAPASGSELLATYRIGQGPAGNVGESSLAHLVIAADPGILRARNPLPAWGGRRPESGEEIRRYAPEAFRVQERAVTAGDYARIAERHPEVAKAAATLRWTGSWLTAFVMVDRRGGRAVDGPFAREIEAFLGNYRLAAQDVEVDGPIFVSIELELHVCLRPGYLRGHVERALLARLGSGVLPDGRCAFFHPDRWTFGQPVYLSAILAEAMQVDGVESVVAHTFQRWGRSPGKELENGVLPIERLEIPRLDNDPNRPENGRLKIETGGGR